VLALSQAIAAQCRLGCCLRGASRGEVPTGPLTWAVVSGGPAIRCTVEGPAAGGPVTRPGFTGRKTRAPGPIQRRMERGGGWQGSVELSTADYGESMLGQTTASGLGLPAGALGPSPVSERREAAVSVDVWRRRRAAISNSTPSARREVLRQRPRVACARCPAQAVGPCCTGATRHCERAPAEDGGTAGWGSFRRAGPDLSAERRSSPLPVETCGVDPEQAVLGCQAVRQPR